MNQTAAPRRGLWGSGLILSLRPAPAIGTISHFYNGFIHSQLLCTCRSVWNTAGLCLSFRPHICLMVLVQQLPSCSATPFLPGSYNSEVPVFISIFPCLLMVCVPPLDVSSVEEGPVAWRDANKFVIEEKEQVNIHPSGVFSVTGVVLGLGETNS